MSFQNYLYSVLKIYVHRWYLTANSAKRGPGRTEPSPSWFSLLSEGASICTFLLCVILYSYNSHKLTIISFKNGVWCKDNTASPSRSFIFSYPPRLVLCKSPIIISWLFQQAVFSLYLALHSICTASPTSYREIRCTREGILPPFLREGKQRRVIKLLLARSISPSLLLSSSNFNVVLNSKKNTSSLRKTPGSIPVNSWWGCTARFAKSWSYFKQTSF